MEKQPALVQQRYGSALMVECLRCRAKPGTVCQKWGNKLSYPHVQRTVTATVVSKGLPEYPAEDRPLRYKCPHCGVDVGMSCRKPNGHRFETPTRKYHKARKELVT